MSLDLKRLFLEYVGGKKIFDKYGYQKSEVKTAPIVSKVQDRIMGLIKRF